MKRSWDNIPDEVIIQSFKKCKISNSLDELENEDDIDETIQDSDKENEEEEFEIEMRDPQAR